MRFLSVLIIGLLCVQPNQSFAQELPEDGIKVLITTAHPDDDAMFAGSVYRITHHFGGVVDLALMTDGAGGYRFSTFAEPIYGKNLTDEKVARQYIPAIRKQELMNGGKIVGVRNYFFVDQPDIAKKNDVEEVLNNEWDRDYVGNRLTKILEKGDYDVIFAMLPHDQNHGAHKAATVMALEAVSRVSTDKKPVVLASWPEIPGRPALNYSQLQGYPSTKRYSDTVYKFDRSQKIGLDGRLNYNIIANWLIAEHKSQGTMQNLMGNKVVERYWIIGSPSQNQVSLVEALFGKLNIPHGEDASSTPDGYWNPFGDDQ